MLEAILTVLGATREELAQAAEGEAVGSWSAPVELASPSPAMPGDAPLPARAGSAPPGTPGSLAPPAARARSAPPATPGPMLATPAAADWSTAATSARAGPLGAARERGGSMSPARDARWPRPEPVANDPAATHPLPPLAELIVVWERLAPAERARLLAFGRSLLART